ncbi:Xaa-Pro dipeptidase [Tahibacter amnicola]|uniref:Xaa-Pro dipeptidase n=1 Tax=Tahibacter amnicola TaxID=2976241 RepID=A0ABY6BMX8_9GAMM|nr:Xaa-Pro dipeptidase [Tahibacter amnicola]UXI69177.1 Xaa-Pro dipeptidase [Tahibacter amnicola]
MPTALLGQLYPEHLATLCRHAATALERGGYDHLLIPAGNAHYQFLDDMPYPFQVNPHFKHWLPITKAPGSWLVITPGKRPQLIYLQPHDYWHVVPEAPAGYWVSHVDITIIRDAADATRHLPADPARCAIIGEPPSALGSHVPNNPEAVVNYLHYQRAWKTDYELAMMRVASKLGVRAHRAAEAAFRAGESEYGIHMAYLAAAHETENELPYGNIIGLNEHGAVLHYMSLDRNPPAQSHSFLIDAGASFHGYACDITRTYAAAHAGEFQALIDAVDEAQRGFCSKVRKGLNYPDLHVHAHHVLGGILRDQGFIRMSPESAVESGVTNTFFPHGLGHYIGLQVHDIGGFQQSDTGGTIPRPPGHPYLRLTRTIDANQVMTIEPGIYFIDMLLAELKSRDVAADVNWEKVDHFRQYGGVRIEDDVVCTGGDPENLTRDAFAAL